MMGAEFLFLKIQHVQAARGGVADHPFILFRIGDQ